MQYLYSYLLLTKKCKAFFIMHIKRNEIIRINSDNNRNIILAWSEVTIILTVEEAKKLVDGLQMAIQYEESTTHE